MAAATFIVLPGCQNRGTTVRSDTDMSTDTRAVPAASTSGFDRPYVATRDSEYAVNPTAAGGDRGTVSNGTRVYFDKAPGTSSDWQQARVEGRGIVYVRPADYQASR